MRNLYLGEKTLNTKENKELARRLASGDIKARERMIAGNAGFAYKRAIKYALMNSRWGHIEDDDILQAAMMGLIEAVDRYDYTKGWAFTTYAHFWISKRISEEISSTHWRAVKPPRQLQRKFLYGKMNEEESSDYVSKFMNSSAPSDLPKTSGSDNQYDMSDLLDMIDRCDLDDEEMNVFRYLYVDGDDSDISLNDITDVESSMMSKIKDYFDEDGNND